MKEAVGKRWRESVCMQVTAQVNRKEVSEKKRREKERETEREKYKRETPLACPLLCLHHTNLSLTSLDPSVDIGALWGCMILNVQAHLHTQTQTHVQYPQRGYYS